jgi:hypothetical protein
MLSFCIILHLQGSICGGKCLSTAAKHLSPVNLSTSRFFSANWLQKAYFVKRLVCQNGWGVAHACINRTSASYDIACYHLCIILQICYKNHGIPENPTHRIIACYYLLYRKMRWPADGSFLTACLWRLICINGYSSTNALSGRRLVHIQTHLPWPWGDSDLRLRYKTKNHHCQKCACWFEDADVLASYWWFDADRSRSYMTGRYMSLFLRDNIVETKRHFKIQHGRANRAYSAVRWYGQIEHQYGCVLKCIDPCKLLLCDSCVLFAKRFRIQNEWIGPEPVRWINPL